MRMLARIAVLAAVALVPLAAAAQDLYMKDTPADTGVEANPDNGPMWVSEDIWVRMSPDPGYLPYPFTELSPPWTPLPHENPEYRDPKYSVPNYVYVRVRNRGNAASTGTERLRIYWAKASTGLAWPTQWVDYVANTCGPSKLFGAELTKPRKNAATATAAERAAYINAIHSIGTLPQFVFFGGVNYWLKQDDIHQFPVGPPNRHGTAAFLPWHREFVNRYEALLQEADPTVKLLYWDWTTDPENSGGFNFFTSSFMGASGRGTANGVSVGAPFMPALAPPDDGDINRRLQPNPPPALSDATNLGPSFSAYPTFRSNLETNSHNVSHTFIGGFVPITFVSIGDMSDIDRAAEDPFFFLLHGDVDRLWAQWQRDPAHLDRLDPATVFGTQSGNVNITTSMRPWDGNPTTADPWTVAGGYVISKLPSSPSVVSPPIYDTAPLTIPPLQPGQAVVIQIPWYPPNPADFSCFGGDKGHFCLLARIETATTAPFGMATLETSDVYANTKANNNIAWKNVEVVDNFAGPQMLSSILLRNPFKKPVNAALRLEPARDTGTRFAEAGRVLLDLNPELLKRWREGGGVQKGLRVVDDRGRVELVDPEGGELRNIKLAPEEAFGVDVVFELRKDYRAQPGFRPKFDLVQLGLPDNADAVVGGQRFELDYQKLVLVPARDFWRYLDNGAVPEKSWTSADFDDARWKRGRAELGYGHDPETTIARVRTAYFRRVFDVSDPSFYRDLVLRLKRDDGAIVYLNGREVHRVNLPADAGPRTPATAAVTGADEKTFFTTPVPLDALRAGRNVVAVELHQTAKNNDAAFDLELAANRTAKGSAPTVVILTPPNGSLWRTGEVIPVRVDAADPEGGKVGSVQLFADGRQVAAGEQPSVFRWSSDRVGPHRLHAVAVGPDQQSASADVTVNVVRNVPPAVRLTQPSDAARFEPGDTIVASAEAADRDGKVDHVEFWIRDAKFFGAKDRLIATAKERPFVVQIRDLKPGMYMLMAVAVDDGGERSDSMPVHLIVNGGADEHANH